MKISAFDFDGTLIKKDSIKYFCRWSSYNYLYFFLIYHIYFRVKKIFTKDFSLKFTRSKFFYDLCIKRALELSEFTSLLEAQEFSDSSALISNDLKNYEVVVVSASFYEFISDYCNRKGIAVVCNSLIDFKESTDINFEKKPLELVKKYGKDMIIEKAYGNSLGDYDLLASSKSSFFRLKTGELIEWEKK